MKHISPALLAFLIMSARWLSQKSSLASYASVAVAIFAKQYQGNVANWVAFISATAGGVLFLLSDAQIQAWLTGQVSPPIKPSMPPAKDDHG